MLCPDTTERNKEMNTNRKTVIAGNWKMNKTAPETSALVAQLKTAADCAACEVVVCPPFTNLQAACDAAAGSHIKVGAQNVHFAQSGAYTGEISAEMLLALGVTYVIVGHSERRQYFGETDETVNKRLTAALNAGLTAILCVGETETQREQGITDEVIRSQLKVAFGGIAEEQLPQLIVAYEPVWAIGTGKTATAAQAEEVCAMIRATVRELYGDAAADHLTVQYGGSMKPGNAAELLAQPDIDGGLIGGAALKAEDFAAIIAACRS